MPAMAAWQTKLREYVGAAIQHRSHAISAVDSREVRRCDSDREARTHERRVVAEGESDSDGTGDADQASREGSRTELVGRRRNSADDCAGRDEHGEPLCEATFDPFRSAKTARFLMAIGFEAVDERASFAALI
jgi:hypothetical protein